MKKDIIQIEFNKRKPAKTKLGRWFYWKFWFTFWFIWRPNILSKFYHFVSELILKILPKSQQIELRKEYDEIDATVDNAYEINKIIKESIKNQKVEL